VDRTLIQDRSAMSEEAITQRESFYTVNSS
jgi:hypothetical protein